MTNHQWQPQRDNMEPLWLVPNLKLDSGANFL